MVIREASGGPATEWPGRRRLSLTVQFSGTDVPRFGVTFTGLRPATRYAYRIASDAGWTDERAFTTAGTGMPAEGWTFLALGDTQLENSTTVKRIVDQAVTDTPEAALMVQVGDVVNEPYDDAQWRDMFQAMGMTAGSRNWLVSIGNHEQCVLIDCDSNGAEAFRSYFDWPDNGYPEQGETWFFTDYQGVRFVVLDSFGGQIVEQAEFLEEALRTNPSDWSVVVQHTPAFSARPDRTNQEIRDLWVPIVERYDVDLVLTGHDHSYARGFLDVDGDGPMYVVSVSGPKFYPVTQRDWIRNGATRVVSAARTPTYQVITVDDRSLSYRAVVAGADATLPEGREVGEILDEFVLIKQADGSKKVRDSATSNQ